MNTTKYSFYYDFCVTYKKFKFVIEFNGDLFHANPLFYKEDDTPIPFDKSITAKMIWERDKIRNDFITANSGYLLTIWENDYRSNKQEVVNYCVSAIEGMIKNVKEDYDDVFEEWIYAF